MKIAVTCAISWPYIRRGNRLPYELAVALGARGHDVHFFTPALGLHARTWNRDGITVEYLPLVESHLLTLAKIQKMVTFVRPCVRALTDGGFDVVQTSHPIDAYAAGRVHAARGTPTVYMLLDCLPPYPRLFLHKAMFRRGVRAASALTPISRFVDDAVQPETHQRGTVITPGVDLAQFRFVPKVSGGPPRILCTASPQVPRKRVGLLVQAFEHVLEARPDAVLQLSGHTDEETNARLLAPVSARTRAAIEILGVGAQGDVPTQYREASISVLPSLNEGFGLVVVESLACGTPVAGTRSGAIPEILDDAGTGRLFAPEAGPKEVAAALLETLELARDPGTAARCRALVEERYAWPRIAEQYEQLYERILAGGRALVPAPVPASPAAAAPGGGPSGDAVESAFDEVLDALEIDLEAYYDLDWHRPRLLEVLRLASAADPRRKAVLALSAFPGALREMLRKLGLPVAHSADLRGSDLAAALGQAGRDPIGAALVDDLAPDVPEETLARVVSLLPPGGALVLSSRGRPQRELEEMLRRAGARVERSRRVHATRAFRRGFASTPVKLALRSGAAAFARRVLPARRSHCVLLARRA